MAGRDYSTSCYCTEFVIFFYLLSLYFDRRSTPGSSPVHPRVDPKEINAPIVKPQPVPLDSYAGNIWNRLPQGLATDTRIARVILGILTTLRHAALRSFILAED
jgi:hypothetical protein